MSIRKRKEDKAIGSKDDDNNNQFDESPDQKVDQKEPVGINKMIQEMSKRNEKKKDPKDNSPQLNTESDEDSVALVDENDSVFANVKGGV